jgi:spermidine synthase
MSRSHLDFGDGKMDGESLRFYRPENMEEQKVFFQRLLARYKRYEGINLSPKIERKDRALYEVMGARVFVDKNPSDRAVTIIGTSEEIMVDARNKLEQITEMTLVKTDLFKRGENE